MHYECIGVGIMVALQCELGNIVSNMQWCQKSLLNGKGERAKLPMRTGSGWEGKS